MSMYQKACKKLFIRNWLTVLLSAVLLCLVTQSPVFADAYLDALNSAADGLELDSKSAADSSASSDTESTQAVPDNMPKGLSQDGFEVFLQKRFFGSFAFYEKLDNDAKEKVFSAYGGKPNIDFVRDQIKRQYLRK